MEQDRGHWGSHMGFILAAAGSAIGLGNLWKFPYVAWTNGGGAFVLIYLLCIPLVGLPIMMAEILIGRKTQKSAVGALREAAGRGWAWVGGLGVVTGFVILSYYTVVAGWTVPYFLKCVGWSFRGYEAGASSVFFEGLILNGGLQVLLGGIFMAFTMSVIYAGVGAGIERIARHLMPVLFGILILLLGSALTMDGAGSAMRMLFTPDFSKLPPLGVLEALGQSFFSLSLGMGAMITYGSYVSRSQSVVRSAFTVVLLDTAIAIIAAAIMFSVILSKAGLAETIEGTSTFGMLFTTLPELFYDVVPLGRVLAPLFYMLVGFAALTSTISLLEVIVAYFIDQRGWTRARATSVCGVVCFLISILCGLSLGASNFLSKSIRFFPDKDGVLKEGVFATLDHLAANWMLPVGGFFITLAAGWIMTREATESELVDAEPLPYFRYGVWRFVIRYVAPIAVAAIIVAVMTGKDFS